MAAIEDNSSGGTPEVAAAPRDDMSDGAPEGFDEIERAFSRVSSVADALLDSIHDDSLRGKERKRERKASQRNLIRSTSNNYVTDSEDEMKEEEEVEPFPSTSTDNYHHNHRQEDVFPSYHHQNDHHHHHHQYGGCNNSYSNESDVSTLGDMTFGDGDESVDGSLVHDVVNLKSNIKAMQAEMQKQEEAFHANVTEGCDGKPFFQKLEEAKAAEDAAKTPRIKNVVPRVNSRPTTISVRNKGKRGGGGQQLLMLTKSQRPPSFLEQLQQFCNQLFGKRPNLPLLAINLVVWLVLFKLLFVARDSLIDGEGNLRMAFAN